MAKRKGPIQWKLDEYGNKPKPDPRPYNPGYYRSPNGCGPLLASERGFFLGDMFKFVGASMNADPSVPVLTYSTPVLPYLNRSGWSLNVILKRDDIIFFMGMKQLTEALQTHRIRASTNKNACTIVLRPTFLVGTGIYVIEDFFEVLRMQSSPWTG